MQRSYTRSGAGRYIRKASVALVLVQNSRLLVGEMQLSPSELGVDMAISEKDVFPSVVVKIEKSRAESEILPVDSEAGGEAGVMKRAIRIIPIHRCNLV